MKTRQARQRFFYKLFISYFVVILIALSLVLINISQTSVISDRQDKEYYQANLNVVKDSVETRLANIRNMTTHIAGSNWADRVSFFNRDTYESYEAIKGLAHHKNSVAGIEAIGIFYKEEDIVVDHTSVNAAPEYFREKFRVDRLDAGKWYSLSSVFQSFNALPVYSFHYFKKPIRGVAFYQTIPPNESVVEGLLFTVLNGDILGNMLDALQVDDGAYAVIIDDAGQIIANSKHYQSSIPLLNYSELREGETTGRSVMEAQAADENTSAMDAAADQYIYYAAKLNYLPWKIVLVTVLPAVNSLLDLPGYYIIAVLFILCVSVITSYVLSIYSYKPLQRLHRAYQAPNKRTIASLIPINEFTDISHNISLVSEQMMQLNSELNHYKIHVAERHLYGHITQESIPEQGEVYIEKAQFVVVIGLEGEYAKQQLYRIASRFRKWMNEMGALTHIVEDFEQHAVLFVWLTEYIGEISEGERLARSLFQHKEKLEKKHKVDIYIGIGSNYHLAKDSLTMNILFQSHTLLTEELPKDWDFKVLSVEEEKQLNKYLNAGDFDSVRQMIERYVQRFRSGVLINVNVYEAIVLYYELLAVTNRHLKIEGLQAILHESEADRNYGARSYGIAHVLTLYEAICTQVNTRNQQMIDESTDLKQQIVAFIDSRFMSQEMSLQLLKDRFHISFALISRYVKQVTGQGFLEYVSRARVERAKEMLENTDHSISYIRESTGFNDDSNFIKVFKKYEGQTPGEYRKKGRRGVE